MDMRLIVARAVGYILLITLVAGLYSLVVFTIEAILFGRQIDLFNLLISATFALIIALSFQPLLRIIEKTTDRVFFKNKYDQTTFFNTLTKQMASTVVLGQLTKHVMQEIITQMKISEMHVVLFIKDHTYSTSHKQFSLEEKEHKKLASAARATEDAVLVFDELTESPEKEIMRTHDISVFLPLLVEGKPIGGICFGPKSSGEIYSEQDIRVLQILAPELAVAIRNALSYEEISNFNITLKEEVERATEKLKKANQRLRELDKQKDEFVSVASHELRTPMTAIRGYLWLALNKNADKLDPTVKHQLEISYQSTLRLINLVNDMLTISRLERSKIEIRTEEMDVFAVCMAVYEELKIQADEKNLTFEINHDSKPYTIHGDKDKLRDVFQNLVGNALKFTKEGYVKIKLHRTEKNIQVSVEDTGPGIQKEDMDKLFGKFAKIEFAYKNKDNVQGTGLGLYITKKIVSLHGGDISVQSEVGKKTTFTVTLPIEEKKQ